MSVDSLQKAVAPIARVVEREPVRERERQIIASAGSTGGAHPKMFIEDDADTSLGCSCPFCPKQVRIMLGGLRLCDEALGKTVPANVIEIATGYRPGLVARIT